MKYIIILCCLFITTNLLIADDFIEKLPFGADEIKAIENRLKSKGKVASYLYSLYFPDKINDHLKLLGHQKFKVRKWAKKTLQNRDFKESIEKILKTIKDPEILENCREILNFYSTNPFKEYKNFSY